MIKRIFKNIKENGILIFIVRILKALALKVVAVLSTIDRKHSWKRLPEYKKLKNIVCDPKYKSVYILYPSYMWHIPAYQRPQQIAMALSKHKDILYIFCTNKAEDDGLKGLYDYISDNLILTHDYLFVESLKHPNKIVQFYSPDILFDYGAVKHALRKKNKVLYEYIDGIDEKLMGKIPPYYHVRHEKVMRNENIYVLASADKLLKDVEQYRKNNYAFICNGVVIDDFRVKVKNVPEDLVDIKKSYDKVVCYYGALASWFDYELVKKCAKKYPKYAFVLIGILYDKTYSKAGLEKYSNIFYLGRKEYTDLVKYSANSDLLTIPFVINHITESTSPVKLFEYMAVQKPILTTALPECKKYKSAIIAKDHDDYIKKIEVAMKLENDKEYLKTELAEAKENSWESKANDIIKLVNPEIKE